MKIQNCNRDKNWLKKCAVLPVRGYCVTAGGRLADTIDREMKLLFTEMAVCKEPDAGVLFKLVNLPELGDEGYRLEQTKNSVEVQGNTTRALLYGMFGLHRRLLAQEEFSAPVCSVPDQSIRMLNHWDNFDGSVERGYAGASIFYSDNCFRGDQAVVCQYARLLASIGINALSINNVNVQQCEARFITAEYLDEIRPLAEIFADYGIRIFLSINYAAPILIGGLSTADPLDAAVAAWWDERAAIIYRHIPKLGGLIVKADSEGEPGPFSYGRNHDDGANMLARALKPYDGVVIWRSFVYNCQQDWRDRSIDRAKAQYENFIGLDGRFEDNVILQIKNGPIDFQVREPVSPLFGALKKTNQILEYQITQEYTGQQQHIFYLLPMWKSVLDFDTGYAGAQSRVGELLRANSPVPGCSGVAAVVNVGMDNNWTGHKLAQANLYGFGRMAWDSRISGEAIAAEWLSLSFDLSCAGRERLKQMLLSSPETYESYTAPNGIGFMVRPGHHYGPDVDGYEYDRWGTYHFADRDGVGADRTAASGTGFTRQYSERRFSEYENIRTCPEELLLFFHHVPYTHKLQSGKTLIQSIYDTHFEGVERVEEYIREWESLRPELDRESFENVSSRLQEQYRCAMEWRDQINTYFYRKSGIPDQRGRIIYG